MKNIPPAKYAIGQPLWNDIERLPMRADRIEWRWNNTPVPGGEWLYSLVGYDRDDRKIFRLCYESDLQPIKYIRNRIAEFLYVIKGGKYEQARPRIRNTPNSPTAA